MQMKKLYLFICVLHDSEMCHKLCAGLVIIFTMTNVGKLYVGILKEKLFFCYQCL